MHQPLSEDAKDLLFRDAHTHNAWLDRPVDDRTLRELYDLLKWPPTAFNASPARFVFLRSREAKERLRPALMRSNVEKTMIAPVTVIVSIDRRFYDRLPELVPQNPSARDVVANAPDGGQMFGMRSGTLQGAYMILAARSLGLDCGPMSGFDNDAVDREFFPEGDWRSNFLCNLGYGDPAGVKPRNPRLAFEDACRVL